MATTTNTNTKPTAASGPYRARKGYAAALAACQQAHPAHRPTLQVVGHLAWRTPGGKVAWHKGTTHSVVAHATALGCAPGTPVPAALATCLAALPTSPSTAALAKVLA